MRGFRRTRHEDLVAWANADGVYRLPAGLVGPWRIPTDAKDLLIGVGLPRFNSLFVPDPQQGSDPAAGSLYILGREEVHPHAVPTQSLDCGCGYFGMDGPTGKVWQVSPDGTGGGRTLVNSSLPLFIYFLNKLGAAARRYQDKREDDMMSRYEQVIARLKKWDPPAMEHPDSFWRDSFDRPWG